MELIFDGNNLAWAGFHALRRPMKAETPEQKARASLLGMTQMIAGIAIRAGEPPIEGVSKQPPAKEFAARLLVAFDEGRPLRRRAVYPGYQMGREGDPNFMDNEPFVLEAIRQFTEAAESLPITILRGVNTEADDLVAAHVLRTRHDHVRIASTDRDFLQLVGPSLSIYAPVKRVVIDDANFSEMTAPRDSNDWPVAFPRERFLDYRAMVGDSSDNLPGIVGVGPLTAARLLAKAPLDAYFEKPRMVGEALERKSLKIEAAFASEEAKQAVARNRELMDLRKAAKLYTDLSGYERHGAWDEAAFRAWAKDQRIAGLDVELACRAFAAAAKG